MDKRTITGTITIAIIFIISSFLFDWFFTLKIWEGLSQWIVIFSILVGAWGLSAIGGILLISGKKAAAIATVCLVAFTPVAWWFLGGVYSGLNPSSSDETELRVGENQAENEPLEEQYEGTLFKYTASFRYLSSKDNEPITNDLFLVFPCPTIDNRPAVDIVGQGDPNLASENVKWQLRAHYENDGQKYIQVEMENGISGRFVKPREDAPNIHKPWLENTSHGPKIKYQFGYGEYNFEKDWPAEDAYAFYHNEEAWFEVEFIVPDNKADRVTLFDNHEGIYAAMAGYLGDNLKTIDGKFKASLAKWTGDRFESVFESSETEWTLLSVSEWQEYRLDN